MKVSVAMPVYNKAPFLKEALDSIFIQTFQDFEIIAVDDKSTDESLAILQGFEDPRLRIIPLEHNLGHPGATQVAFEHSRGEYILRFDADDLCHPERFVKQVAYMDAHPEVGLSGSGIQLFGNSTDVWKYPVDNAACQAHLFFNPPVADGASIIRRSVLETHQIGFNASWPRVGADWLLMIELAAVTQFGNLDEPLLLYRRGDQNISARSQAMEIRQEATRLGLRMLGLEGTKDQVRHHLACSMYMPEKTPDQLRGVHDWLRRLEQLNGSLGHSPELLFRRETERIWKRLFFLLERADRKTLWTYIRLNGGLSAERVLYLLKVRLAPFLKRGSSGT